MIFRVGIIGCGFIGKRRADALGEGQLIACADLDEARATAVAAGTGARVFTDWRELLAVASINVVIIATLHDSLATITLAAIEAGKHVFVEKPGARSSHELESVMTAAVHHNVKVRVGFNHRYHRAFRKARELCEQGSLGDLMFIRARYGHGGRLGYEKEWRANPEISGGGELVDQGPHLIDLSRWFLGEFVEVDGFARTFFWDMPVDDNAFMLLKTARRQVAFLHVSCTEWKNLFSMEIVGQYGKLEVFGLGGSYGAERLTYYKMLPEMGPPVTTIWEYPMPDNSWAIELAEFYEDIRDDRIPSPGLQDAHATLKVIEKIYQRSSDDYRP